MILGLSTMPSTTWNNLQNHILAWEGVGGGASTPLTSVENYARTTTNFFLLFCDYNVQILWRVIHHWKGVFNIFPTVYSKPPKFQNFQLVKPKKICSHLATVEHIGQKNCNGKTTNFFASALKESRAFAYYWQCLLVRIGWSILWSSISKKIIAKALDFNDIINFFIKLIKFSSMSPNLSINNQIRPPIEIWKLIIHWVFSYYEGSPSWVKILAPPLILAQPIHHPNKIRM